jgi:hypothetical protein
MLPEDFDPCQPHRVLPWVEPKVVVNNDGKQGFGQIKVLLTQHEQKETSSKTNYSNNIKVINPEIQARKDAQRTAQKDAKSGAFRKKA